MRIRGIGLLAAAAAQALALAGTPAAAAEAPLRPVYLPGGGEHAPLLDALGPLDGLAALALGPGGRRAAVALLDARDPRRQDGPTRLRLLGSGESPPTEIAVPGQIRGLLFSVDGDQVYALQHRPARKREGDTYLLQVDFETGRARREMRLPPSSRGLDHWTSRGALLVACRNEVRTVALPDLRSGPLFRIPGENLAVASLGDSRILVGQDRQLLLVDLDDPPGRDEMPARQRLDAPAAVVDLSAAAGGSGALAQLADGRVFRVELAPLALGEQRAAGVLGRLAPPSRQLPAQPSPPARARVEPAAPAPPLRPAAAPAEGRAAPAAPPPAEPGPPPAPRPAPPAAAGQSAPPPVPAAPSDDGLRPQDPVRPAPATAGPAPAPPPREPAAAALPPQPAAPPTPRPATAPDGPAAPPESTTAAADTAPQVAGRLSGPAATLVLAVVLLGPDNVLREAARVAPQADGRWSADGLAPGRYRVQLDGGGGRVLLSEPPFLVLDVRSGERLAAPELRVLRAL